MLKIVVLFSFAFIVPFSEIFGLSNITFLLVHSSGKDFILHTYNLGNFPIA